jgi:hypothetical protein
MAQVNESGKSRLIKGSLLYLWEEIKTLNRMKVKALARIISGYIKMKYRDQKRLTSNRN